MPRAREPAPMRSRAWKCRHCAQTIGTVDRQASTLFVTLRGVFVEHAGRLIYIHCSCGEVKRFGGQRVILRPGTSETQRKAS